jgi:HEAT repeat
MTALGGLPEPCCGRLLLYFHHQDSMSLQSETTPSKPGVPTLDLREGPDGCPVLQPRPEPGISRTQKILFFATGWLIVLMPFLFWWSTWFGRTLSNQQLTEYLHDTKKPRHIQQALVQVSERITRHDAAVKQWYPDLVRLGGDPVEEVRNTDAWVMGQDTSVAGFHETLLKMLKDSSPMVRGNAALSLVRFGDATGRPQIVALLQPASIPAPQSGRVVDSDRPGTAIHQGGLLAKLDYGRGQTEEIRSPIPGRIRSVAQAGANVTVGAEIAVVDPATEQVWEALRALFLTGQMEDLPSVRPYERDLPDISNDVRQQAVETERAIRERAK